MALDGITIASIIYELNHTLADGRLYKIAQPEPDELLLTVRGKTGQYRLTVSANAGLPLIYLTDTNKPSPMTAPNFCMLLRKHLNNARILSVTQPGLERSIDFCFEHLDEMGDLCTKHLYVELMGKHSNIIFTDDKDVIIDSIKHISAQVSSVREVLPGRKYFIPDTTKKCNPLDLDYPAFTSAVLSKPVGTAKALYTSLTGISPVIAEELAFRAGLDSSLPANTLDEAAGKALYQALSDIMDDVKANRFVPAIIYKDNKPVEFAPVPLTIYRVSDDYRIQPCASVSQMLCQYYSGRNAVSRIQQRSSDLRKIVSTLLERNCRKLDIQEKQLKDTQKREKYRIYGELLNTYGYEIAEGSTSFDALNYYTNETVTIPLDGTLSAKDNAIRYFDKYNKLKRTYEASLHLLEETNAEIEHLESIQTSLNIAVSEDDLLQIREEMVESGYIHKKGAAGKKIKSKSKPFHYVSSDGFHIYVGKNNIQNEELSFKIASGGDWWFHAKKMPGSHVIVKSDGKELPDSTFEEAARLAAHYSKGGAADKVEVDYTPRKNLKKPAGSKPGYVIYHTNFSMIAPTDISGIQQIEEKL